MKFIYNLQIYNIIFELINSYWVETLKVTNNATLKYLWWKVDFKKQLINGLKKKQVPDLPDLTLSINKIDELCDDFDPTQFVDSKLYIEKLVKMSKELKKKKINQQKRFKKIFATAKPLCW